MSGNVALADAIAEQLGLDSRRWFGGWSLRRGGQQIAIVMDTLYLRVDDVLRAELDATGESRLFRYLHRDGQEIEVDAYRAVPPRLLNDPQTLNALIDRVPVVAPPRPAPRRR